MAYEARPNSGSLFPNDKKEADKHPDFRGDIRVSEELVAELAALVNAGKPAVFKLAGWKKKSDKGTSWMSLQASSANFKGTGSAAPKKAAVEDDPF